MTTTDNASPNTPTSMGQLAQAAMPAGTQQMIANIDTILASAKQVIDQSIMQSEALIAKSQHQLDADVSANPAPANEATPSAPPASTPTATDTPEQEALLKEQQQYQQTMLAQQQKLNKRHKKHSKHLQITAQK